VGELANAKYAELIMPYLESEQDIVKIAATKALAQMRAEQAKPALERLKEERNQDVATAAETALNEFGGKRS
jgi:HEAT repeat protein